LRESDTIARLGGDEFAALLPTATPEMAVHTAQRLLAALELPFDLDGRRVDVRASIGIAPAESGDDTSEALLRRADVAMYTAKRATTGYALYTSDEDQNSPEQLALAADLRVALAENQLQLHYQPKLDLRTGRVTSAEALVRWHHPQRGLVLPAAFIPLAESIGLIDALSEWVLNAAVKQCRAWRDVGIDLAIAVNLSMRNLHDPELPDTIASLLGAHGLLPESLILEITESTLMADPNRALSTVGALRHLGVRLSIDDFGTGYSSLVHLKQLPVDELKIDRGFVRHLATNANDAAIVRSTIALAHDLGLTVVAEGVEERRACELLAGYGCDVAQGYYISRPAPAEQIPALLQRLTAAAQESALAA
jgi:predicted signal transduction protein with EAL and GGDEF domain